MDYCASYSETGAVITSRFKNKPGGTKIGQTVLIGNENSSRLCAYMHRHEMHSNPPSWMMMGNIDVKNLMEDIKPMNKGEGGDRKKSLKSIHILPLINNSVGEILQTSLDGKALVVPSLVQGTAPLHIFMQSIYEKRKIDTSDKKFAGFFQYVVTVKMLRWWNK